MVLSRKKLKRKFRALLAQSLAVNESNDSCKDASSAAEANHELQNIREFLTTKSRRTKPSKRGQRGIKKPITDALKNGGGILEGRLGNGENEGLVVLEKKSKKAERKKVKDGGQELEEGFKKEERNFPKKKKDKQKKNKKRRDLKLQRKGKDGMMDGKGEKNNEGEIQSMNGLSGVAEVVMPAQINESEVKKVYVGGIPYYSNEDDIRSFFEGCGTVTEMDCMTFPETGKFRGIAILSFKTEGAAKRALGLDGADMGGFYLKIQPYKSNRNHRSEFAPDIIDGYNRAYVGNLSWDASEDDLKQLFSDCKISAIRFGADKTTGDFKGYAHVDFADSVSLAVALKLDQTVVRGRPVRVSCAVPRKNGRTETCPKLNNSEKREGDSVQPKKKRRTCYECGVPGHLSADCPRRRDAGEPAAVL